MPVYVRKSNLLTAPSLSSEIPDHDVWDFLQDPTLMVDQLPQPFRMVNKVVVQLVEDAWDTIADRENERITEAARYKPPQYKCGLRTQVRTAQTRHRHDTYMTQTRYRHGQRQTRIQNKFI